LKQLENSPFLKACLKEEVPYTPIWLMRQAGRYMKEYRDLRKNVSFLELCKNAELCSKATVTAQERIGADAAIIFSDLLIILESFGFKLEYLEKKGPVITGPDLNQKTIHSFSQVNIEDSLSCVANAISLTQKNLKPNIPLIGFSGAPFTLASYLIEGGSSRDFSKTKQFMDQEPSLWNQLMEVVSRAIIQYVKGQIKAGADAIQIFDSWVGCLRPEEYETQVLPFSQKVLGSIKGEVPIIHFGTGTAPFLNSFSKAGGDVVGVDHRISLDDAQRVIGAEKAIQGNLDPMILFETPDIIRRHVKRILEEVDGRPGFIFNLGHGVKPETPVENVIALVDMVHEMSACPVEK